LEKNDKEKNVSCGTLHLYSETVSHQLAHARHALYHDEKAALHDHHRKLAHDVHPPSPSNGDQMEVITDGQNIVLKGIDSPEPVYFCCIEPPSTKSNHEFERALSEIAVEDPSLRIRYDSEMGQTVVETMGELHMDIIKNRLVRDYGLNVFVGPLQIAYREIVGVTCHTDSHCPRRHGGEEASPQRHPHSYYRAQDKEFRLGLYRTIRASVSAEASKAINEGCQNALHNGPILGFPVQDVVITLNEINTSGGRVNPAVLSACAHKCVSEAIEKARAHLIEPVMRLDITLEKVAASTGRLFTRFVKAAEQTSLRMLRNQHC
ncbi:hypothetical protein COOONC_16217, partial [Cooperia oncophora]